VEILSEIESTDESYEDTRRKESVIETYDEPYATKSFNQNIADYVQPEEIQLILIFFETIPITMSYFVIRNYAQMLAFTTKSKTNLS
jgi:hypothetical protein